jgi:Type II secretion system (T2SS), protein E, N-terminal domain
MFRNGTSRNGISRNGTSTNNVSGDDAGISPDSAHRSWRALWKLAGPTGAGRCPHSGGLWRRLRGKPSGIVLQGSWYCLDSCLEPTLAEILRSTSAALPHAAAPHRVPLGLLLLSREQLTIVQLRAALAAQRDAGQGRIGEWLQQLGFASEQQVTAALARQSSCPVLQPGSFPAQRDCPLQIPVTLLESFVMVPVAYISATAVLHMAFGEKVDYGVLNALERMLGCRTEPCLVVPSLLRERLQSLSGRRGEREIRFDQVADVAEFTRIVRSYCVLVAACEMRIASCGAHLWVRLHRPASPPLDLLLRSPA